MLQFYILSSDIKFFSSVFMCYDVMYNPTEIHKIIIHHLCEIRDSKKVKIILDMGVYAYGTCYLIARLEYLKDVTLY